MANNSFSVSDVHYYGRDDQTLRTSVLEYSTRYHFQGHVSGYNSGGYNPTAGTNQNIIDKFPFTVDANATDVGDLTTVFGRGAAQSSSSHGFVSGGDFPSVATKIERFSFLSDSNAIDTGGDLTVARSGVVGQSSSEYGFSSGGSYPAVSNVIDRFPFTAPFATAVDVGNLSVSIGDSAGMSSTEYGYTSGGGLSPIFSNVIDKFPFASPFVTATDVGDLTVARTRNSGQSSREYGYASGGQDTATPTNSDVIDRFSFTSDGNSSDVGNLSFNTQATAGQSSTTHGYASGGYTNYIHKFPFVTPFITATDAGDLTLARGFTVGHQY